MAKSLFFLPRLEGAPKSEVPREENRAGLLEALLASGDAGSAFEEVPNRGAQQAPERLDLKADLVDDLSRAAHVDPLLCLRPEARMRISKTESLFPISRGPHKPRPPGRQSPSMSRRLKMECVKSKI